MSTDLSKLNLDTRRNSFKNVSKYNGSITFPTSIAAGTTILVTTSFTLTDNPIFTQFYCYFVNAADVIAGSNIPQWYSQNESGNGDIGVKRLTPTTGTDLALIYPAIHGNVVTITGAVFNGSSSTATYTSLTVPFSFIEYTLAN